jgi:hypothetical protein
MALGRRLCSNNIGTIKRSSAKPLSPRIKTMAYPEVMVKGLKKCCISDEMDKDDGNCEDT